MFNEIKNKKVLVTGASSGIGASIAKLFLEHGAAVGLHYSSNKEGAENIQKSAANGMAEIFQGDLLEENSRKQLVPEFIRKFGGIDVLINNAGAGFEHKHFSKLYEEEWNRMFDLHAKAPFYLTRSAFAHMEKQKWGRIINISTNAMEYAGAYNMHYYASKAALDAFTKGFAKEGAANNILVNTIRCGVIGTPMRTKIIGYEEKRFLERVSMVPIKRAGKPLDIARLVLFLASECGDFITGEIFKVAGGE